MSSGHAKFAASAECDYARKALARLYVFRPEVSTAYWTSLITMRENCERVDPRIARLSDRDFGWAVGVEFPEAERCNRRSKLDGQQETGRMQVIGPGFEVSDRLAAREGGFFRAV